MSSTGFFQVGGSLGANQESYIKRPADDELYSSLLDGHLVYVFDSRQKGKSSLISQVSHRLEQAGVETVKLDLQRFGANLSVEQWYGAMIQVLGTRFGLLESMVSFWREHSEIGPMARWFLTLESVLLQQNSNPIVIFVDEIDFIQALPFSVDEFFAGIRDSVDRRSSNPDLKRLNFCLVGVAYASQLVSNTRVTPFNIGKRVRLTDFSREELSIFDDRLSTPVVDRIFSWTNGHPYLTQLIAQASAPHNPASVDLFVQKQLLSTSALESEPNFADTERRLLEVTLPGYGKDESRTRILNLYKAVREGKSLIFTDDDPAVNELLLSGLVVSEGGKLAVRNRLYREIFSLRWRESHLPGAELRRQKEAARKAVRRSSAIFLAVMTMLSCLCIWLFLTIRQRDESVAKMRTLNAVNQRMVYEGAMQLATFESEKGNFTRLTSLIKEQLGSSLKGWEYEYWNSAIQEGKQALDLGIGSGKVIRTVWFEDGLIARNDETGLWIDNKRVGEPLVATGYELARSKGQGTFFDRLRRLRKVDPKKASEKVAISGDGRWVARREGRQLILTDTFVNKPVWRSESESEVLGFTFSPDSQLLVLFGIGHQQEFVEMRRIADKKLLWRKAPARDGGCIISPDSKEILIGGEGHQCLLVSAVSGRTIASYEGHFGQHKGGVFMPKHSWVATSCLDGAIRVFDRLSGKPVRIFIGHRASAVGLGVDETESKLVSQDSEGIIKIWDLRSQPREQSISAASVEIQRMRISGDGSRIALAARDGTISLVDARSFTRVFSERTALVGEPSRISLTPDSVKMAFLSSKSQIKASSTRSGRAMATIDFRAEILGFHFLDNKRLIAWDRGQDVMIVDITTGLQSTVYHHQNPITALQVDPKSDRVAFGDNRGSITLIDEVSTRRRTRQVKSPEPLGLLARVLSVRFSPDGTHVVAGMYHKRIAMVNTLGEPSVRFFDGHTARVWNATFSPDGTRIVSNSFDNTARIWDVTTLRQTGIVQLSSWVSDCAWAPNSQRIVIGSADGTMRVVNGTTGVESFRAAGHHLVAYAVAFSQDGKSVFSTDSAGVLRRWNTN